MHKFHLKIVVFLPVNTILSGCENVERTVYLCMYESTECFIDLDVHRE